MTPFAKMHGLGNDFVVFDAVSEPIVIDSARAHLIADRRRGIGCDQILLVEPTDRPDADYGYRIFNADGSESDQCGNGARCIARFIADRGLGGPTDLVRLATRDGRINVTALGNYQYRASLGVPVFEPASIPLVGFNAATAYRLDDIAGHKICFDALSVGNPHAIIDVDDVDNADVASIGPALESHASFPERVNVSFVQILSRNHIRLRVYERGAGQTFACGSAAAAATISGIRRGRVDERVTVDLPGGAVTVAWSGDRQPVYLSGPASHVFDGTIDLNYT